MMGTSTVKIGDVNDVVYEGTICVDDEVRRRRCSDVVSLGSKIDPAGNGHATEGKEHFLPRMRCASRGETKFEVEKIEDVMQEESPSRPFRLGICVTC